MRFSIFDFRFLIAVFLASATVRADATWTLTTADFNQQGVDLLSLDQNGATVLVKTAKTTIPLDNFLEVRRLNAGSLVSGKFMLYMNGGDRLAGEPSGASAEQLKWTSPAVGELSIALNQIRAITKSGQKPIAIDEPRQEDTVKLANGDAVKGILTDLSAKDASVQVGNDVSKVPLDNVTAIYFATAAGAAKRGDAANKGFRVGLADGSTFLARSVAWDAGKVTLTFTDGAARPIDPTKIISIEQVNGPVSWLSSRTPSEIVQIPFLDTPWPTGFDTNVTGDPIRFADRTYSRGIGVHSYSRISFPLDGAYPTFRTQYAIDGDGAYADVTVRIKLDGKTVHEQHNFKSGVLSKPIVLDVSSAKTLTLEVDYGQYNDTQDRFNWIEPALLKRVPPPAP